MPERATVLKCVTFDFWFCLFFCTASSPQMRVRHHSGAHRAAFLYLPGGPQYQLPHQHRKQTARATGNDLPEKKDMKLAYRELKAQHARPIPAAIRYTPTGSKHEPVPPAMGKAIARGFFQQSDSVSGKRAFVVAKPAGKWRLVLDHCHLDSQVSDDPFPVPVIEDMILSQGQKCTLVRL